MKRIIAVLLLVAVIASCKKSGEIEPKDEFSKIELSLKDKELINSNNEFGLDLFVKTVASEESNENIFVSPLSVAFALAMTYNGADGETKAAMEETLKLSGLTTEEINKSFKYLMNELLNLDPKIVMQIANSIWYKDTFTVLDEFLDVNQNYYNAEVAALDFTDPAAVDIINNWIANKTNNKIIDMLDFIPSSAVMYLVNAIYYKGIWQYTFDETDTEDKAFYTEDGSIAYIPTMSQKADFNYFANDLVKVLEIPYGQGNFNMIVVLPTMNNTCDDVLEQLNNENWNTWISGLYEAKSVNLFLSKFKFDYKIKLNDVLKQMGMGVAFDGSLADFSKINPLSNLYISRVLHQTFVDVNEEGTEAAAATIVEIVETSSGSANEFYFRVDKPFIFAITEKSTSTILFIGKVVMPVYEE